MTLNFLSKCGVTSDASAEVKDDVDLQVEMNEQSSDLALIAKVSRETDNAIESMGAILKGLDVVTGLTHIGVESAVVAGVYGVHLEAAGVPNTVADAVALGCESSSTDVGTESTSSAADLIRDIVAWLVRRWKSARAAFRRTFARSFGSIKRATEKMRNLKTRIESYQEDGRTVEDKSKLEITSGAEWVIVGKSNTPKPTDVVAWDKMDAEIERYSALVDLIEDLLVDDTLTDFPDDAASIPNSTGTYVSSCMNKVKFGKVQFQVNASSPRGLGYGLLGRLAAVTLTREGSKSNQGATEKDVRDNTQYLNGVKIGIRPSNTELKPLDSVNVAICNLTTLESLVDSYIELGDKLLAVQTGKALGKIEQKLDKAIVSAEKWSKDTKGDTAADKRLAVATANLGVARISLMQSITLDLANDVLRHGGALLNAHGSIASKVLSRYKAA